MKKILIVMMMVAAGCAAQAQWGDYGVKAGLGIATFDDDLVTKSPVGSVSIGGYANYTFAESQSVLAEIFYLQTGLNLVRKGCNFEESLQNINNMMVREGYYHAWYAQIPILACVHMELPVRQVGHVVGIFLGPTLNMGLFGTCHDRRITPTVSSRTANYDIKDGVFNHLNRFDVGALLGVTYEHRGLVFSAFIDRGFLATSTGEDILRVIQNAQNGNNDLKVNIPNGNNLSYMVSVSYRLGNF